MTETETAEEATCRDVAIVFTTKKASFPPQYTQTCRETILAVWEYLSWLLREEFGLHLPELTAEQLECTFFAQKIALVAGAAAGTLTENSDEGEMCQAIQDLMTTLFGGCFEFPPTIPETFWETNLGRMISKAREAVSQYIRRNNRSGTGSTTSTPAQSWEGK